ncbi:MAG: DUF1801 domain-containing protein [Saprospiraceae bacterium]|nr:DUF1801 domain-containing protein [Saprospiraceae bacterium]
MAELKTQPTTVSVQDFIASLEDQNRRDDCHRLYAMMQSITGDNGTMWGPAIAGFGTYHYKGKSGREGDWFVCGFSPRKQNLTLYLTGGFTQHEELLAKLGKHKISGGSCLYIKRLSDVNLEVLTELVRASFENTSSQS